MTTRHAGHRTGRALVGSVAVLATLGLLAGCGGGSDSADPAPSQTSAAGTAVAPPPVVVGTAEDADATGKILGKGVGKLKIGILTTFRSADPGQGRDDWSQAAGATVAAYRLRLGGADVSFVVENDSGTKAKASSAMKKLIAKNVSGVIVASTGDHLLPALATASKAQVPVLLPYYRPASAAGSGVWFTGPSDDAVDHALTQGLAGEGLTKTLVVSADGVTADGVKAAESLSYGGDPTAIVSRISRDVDAGKVDSVLIAGSATTQSEVVAALQQELPSLPVALTPEALTPGFAKELVHAGGTLSADVLSAGVDAADATTLGTTEQAAGVASYFAAMRLADSSGAKDLYDSRLTFGERGVATADTASHDAVIALATAAHQAGSTDPADVLAALQGLQVSAADGLAGPALDFSGSQALADDDVVPLRATSQDPGVRPAVAQGSDVAPLLFWFPVPDGSGNQDNAGGA